jgi:hypothetical protein
MPRVAAYSLSAMLRNQIMRAHTLNPEISGQRKLVSCRYMRRNANFVLVARRNHAATLSPTAPSSASQSSQMSW